MEFADGIACLRIRSRGYSAGVYDDYIGTVGSTGQVVALRAELALDGGGVGLCGATAELLDVERGHVAQRLQRNQCKYTESHPRNRNRLPAGSEALL